MSIEEFVLTPAQGNPLAFQGRIVARAEGDPNDRKLHGRRHVVTIYEVSNGWLHAQIEFLTTCPGEKPVTVVEDRLHLDDIESVLMVYDPVEYMTSKLNDFMRPNEAIIFKKALWQQFDRLTKDIQTQLYSFVSIKSKVEAEHAGEKAGSRWSSWLPFKPK